MESAGCIDGPDPGGRAGLQQYYSRRALVRSGPRIALGFRQASALVGFVESATGFQRFAPRRNQTGCPPFEITVGRGWPGALAFRVPRALWPALADKLDQRRRRR